MELTDTERKEARKLAILATSAIVWLVLLSLWCLVVAVQLLVAKPEPTTSTALLLLGTIGLNADVQVIALCIIGGTIGSSAAALLSVLERVANGWEFSSGKKYPPEQGKGKEMFLARMVPYFLVRPILGSGMGLLMYLGIAGGFLIVVIDSSQKDFSLHGLTFLAILAGLFAKTFFEKLKEIFKALVGK